jgi:hypothetical protein
MGSVKLFGKEYSVEEFLVGALLQLPFYFLFGGWVMPLSFVCGCLWAYGGASGTSKLWRRLGIPLVITVALMTSKVGFWAILATPMLMLILSMGYGKESFVWKSIRDRKPHKEADIITRTILYLLYWSVILGIIYI